MWWPIVSRIADVTSIESGIETSRIGNRRWVAVSNKYEYGGRLSFLSVKSIKTVIPEWVKALILKRMVKDQYGWKYPVAYIKGK